MKTFSNEIKQSIISSQNGICKECLNKIHSLHHKLPNTLHNQETYPLLIQSPINAVGLCYDCHTHRAYKYKIDESEAQVYEDHLETLQYGKVLV